MKKYYKIIISFIALIISLFSLVQETGAVTYGGNSSFAIPSFTGITSEEYIPSHVGSNSYGFSAQQWSVQYAILQKYNTAWTFFFSHAIVIQMQKWGLAWAYSGSIVQFWNNSDCGDTTCTLSIGYDIVQTPFSGGLHYTLRILGGTYFVPYDVILEVSLHDYDQTNCAWWWTDSDCVYVVKPNFVISNTPWSVGVYFQSIDTYFYAVGYQVKHLSTLPSGIAINQTWQQSFLDLFFNSDNHGVLISQRTDYTAGWIHYWTEEPIHSPVTVELYTGVDAPSRASDNTITSFLTTFWGDQNSTLPNWLGATSISEINQTGSIITWSGYFDNCNTVDVWCYMKWFYNWIKDWLYQFFTQFVPDFSFSWNFDSCGSFSSGNTSQTTYQKLGNVIALINPFPPSDWSEICTIFWPRTIVYWVMWPEQNFFQKYIPWQIPALEVDPHIAYGQTIVDIITIVSVMLLIFYHKSKHD